jgi:hypothetical protein
MTKFGSLGLAYSIFFIYSLFEFVFSFFLLDIMEQLNRSARLDTREMKATCQVSDRITRWDSHAGAGQHQDESLHKRKLDVPQQK